MYLCHKLAKNFKQIILFTNFSKFTNMRKTLLFAMGAMMSMASYAQEEDVTSYIQNPGFDEDLTWQANGGTKEIVDKTKEFSNRSFGWMAADSTVYAYGRGTRGDGASPAWNGFFGQIKGWTAGDKSYTGKAYYPYGTEAVEWVYFGSVPYDLGERAIPIADDGTTFLAVPAKPAADSGDDNKGFVYLRAGWGGAATYKQTVKLPCAQYRLEYWAINTNPSATKGKNLSRVVCRKDVFKDETGFTDTEWTKHIIEFTPTAEFSMEFGFQSEGGSNGNPFLCIDGIRLFKIGEADPDEINTSDLNDMINECSELSGIASQAGFSGLANWLSDYGFSIEDDLGGSGAELEAAVKKHEARMAQIRLAIEEMPNVDAMLAKMDELLQTTNYAGKADFETAYQKILGYKENVRPVEEDVPGLILGAVAEANEAIKAYYISQDASVENPADFTYFVQNSWFIKTGFEPTFVDGIWVFPNADNYSDGSSNGDFTSEGWAVTGTYTGGDQRLNYKFGRSCWNAWGSGINGTIAVGQTIENLPNGYYTASADLVTQSGCLTDQHVYLQSTSDKKISPALTAERWDDGEWETVSMTAEQKVLVVDGKLTIGAEGTGTGSGSAGWFCVTNFRLNFLGKATDEEINTAVKKSFDEKINAAKELAGKMHFAADKKALNDTIAAYEGTTEYLAAFEPLTAAIAEAEKSEAKYVEYLPTETPEDISGKTLLWVKALIDGQAVEGKTAYSDGAKAIAQFAYDYVMGWVACDTATYTQMDNTVNLLKNYVNTYLPAYQNAEEVAQKAAETGKKYLEDIMAIQKAALVAEMQTLATINELIAQLKNATILVNKQNTVDDASASDYTAFIINPNAEALDGWDIEIGNGDGNGQKSGQWFDGSSTRYFDSYHSSNVTDTITGEVTTVGLVGFRASQLVKDLPNGTYTVGAYVRTPAEGAYIFAAPAADTTFVEIPLSYYVDETTSEEVVASDKYGPIWEEAKEKIIGTNPLSESDPEYAYYNAIYNANNALGRGWKHMTIENVVVENHQLLIGTMTGTAASKTEKVFAGAWYSVGGWTLTQTAKGNNDGWAGPIVEGIESVKTGNQAANGIYSLTGVRMNQMQRGLNIVVRDGKALKVLVK